MAIGRRRGVYQQAAAFYLGRRVHAVARAAALSSYVRSPLFVPAKNIALAEDVAAFRPFNLAQRRYRRKLRRRAALEIIKRTFEKFDRGQFISHMQNAPARKILSPRLGCPPPSRPGQSLAVRISKQECFFPEYFTAPWGKIFARKNAADISA